MDEELAQALLKTTTTQAFCDCYEQHTGRTFEKISDIIENEDVWKHFREMMKAEDPNRCIMPDGIEMYISMGLRKRKDI